MHRLIFVLAAAALPLLSGPLPRVESVVTNKLDFAPGGTIRIAGSTGELNVEGWDENAVEVTATRYIFSGDEAKAKRELDLVQIAKPSVSGGELTVATTHKRMFGVHVDYRIRVPRNSKLVIRHGIGDVVVFDVGGDIDATARIGAIMLQLPAGTEYAVDARNKMGGGIYSEYAGKAHHTRPIFGERLESPAAGAAHRLRLRVGVGGITIQKMAA